MDSKNPFVGLKHNASVQEVAAVVRKHFGEETAMIFSGEKYFVMDINYRICIVILAQYEHAL